MNFELVSLDGVKFKGQAYAIVLPTLSGQITVQAGHEPLLSVLKPGVITIRRKVGDPDYHLESYATYGGVVEVTKSGVRVMVDEAVHGSEVSEAEAQKAHEVAVRLRQEAKTQIEIEKAQAVVDRHALRLDVARLHRRNTTRRGGTGAAV